MLLHISEQSSETLQEQIISQIRARVLNGDLSPEQALPSIRGLAKELRVSVITVQRAYDHLLNAGLIYARRGKGYFVAALPEQDKSALASSRFSELLSRLLVNARLDGLSTQQIEEIFSELLQGENNEHS